MAFQKGVSGNPNGRPTHRMPDGRTVSEAARDHAQAAFEALVAVMADEKAPHSAVIAAATAILDRGFGKPTQPIAGDDESAPIRQALDLTGLSTEALRELAKVCA